MNAKYYKEFLIYKLGRVGRDHILAEMLWTTLGSSSMIASLRVCAILHYSIVMPHRYLTGKSKDLLKDEATWGIENLKEVADLIYRKLGEVELDPGKFLNEDFMMTIFKVFENRLPSFKKYLKYMFEGKGTLSIRGKRQYKPHAELRKALFHPSDESHKETDDEAKHIGQRAVARIRAEMIAKGPGKNTRQFMSCLNGPQCFVNVSEEQKRAGVGKDPHNSAAERNFAILTDHMSTFGNISELHAAGMATSKVNGDFDIDKDGKCVGYWYGVPWQLRHGLLIYAENNKRDVAEKARELLKNARSFREDRHKEQVAAARRAAKKKLATKLTNHKLFFSCKWRTLTNCLRCLPLSFIGFVQLKGGQHMIESTKSLQNLGLRVREKKH